MHIIAKSTLVAFSDKHPAARERLLSWYRTMKSCHGKDFNELKLTFNSADYVPKKFTVFDVGGNEYRIVAVVLYDAQKVYLRHVGTHAEYDKWTKEKSRKMSYPDQSSSAMPELEKAWAALQQHALLRPIRNHADFVRVHALADALSDEVGDDESHSLFSLFELTMDLIQRWEDAHVMIPDAEPKEVLRFLLEENNLKQKDLSDIASPTLVSDILAGRRGISRTLAKRLAARFHVNVAAFL